MNKKIILVSILSLFCWYISGQENDQQPSDFRYAGSEVIPVFYEGYKVENKIICQYNIGSFSLYYRYHFTERLSLGIVSTLLFSKIVDKYNVEDHSGFFTFWTLEPQFRFTYKRFKHCALYMGGALGLAFRIASNDKLPYWDTAGGGLFSISYGSFFVMPSSHITLFGISLGKDNVANYRIDRITDIRRLDTKRRPFTQLKDSYGNSLNLGEYMKHHIYMFAGDNTRMRFRAVKVMISDIIDIFGKDVIIEEESDTHIIVTVRVNEAAIIRFAQSFAPDVVILDPPELADMMKDWAKKVKKAYGG